VYLTKSLGDKLTQGQLDAQEHRIPERKGLFESRDPKQQIEDAQRDADLDFARDMNVVGIDVDPIIEHAKASRARPEPTPDEALTASHTALSTAKTDSDRKDAEVSLTIAKARKQHEIDDIAHGEHAEESIQGLKPGAIKPHPVDDLPSDFAADVTTRNELVKQYDAKLSAYQALTPPKVDASHEGRRAKGRRRLREQAAETGERGASRS
jgi:hypothetical protein